MKYLAPLADGISIGPDKSLCTNLSRLVAIGLDVRLGTAARVVLETTQEKHFCQLLSDMAGRPRATLLWGIFKSQTLITCESLAFQNSSDATFTEPTVILPHCPQSRTERPIESQLQYAPIFPHSASAISEGFEYTF